MGEVPLLEQKEVHEEAPCLMSRRCYHRLVRRFEGLLVGHLLMVKGKASDEKVNGEIS